MPDSTQPKVQVDDNLASKSNVNDPKLATSVAKEIKSDSPKGANRDVAVECVVETAQPQTLNAARPTNDHASQVNIFRHYLRQLLTWKGSGVLWGIFTGAGAIADHLNAPALPLLGYGLGLLFLIPPLFGSPVAIKFKAMHRLSIAVPCTVLLLVFSVFLIVRALDLTRPKHQSATSIPQASNNPVVPKPLTETPPHRNHSPTQRTVPIEQATKQADVSPTVADIEAQQLLSEASEWQKQLCGFERIWVKDWYAEDNRRERERQTDGTVSPSTEDEIRFYKNLDNKKYSDEYIKNYMENSEKLRRRLIGEVPDATNTIVEYAPESSDFTRLNGVAPMSSLQMTMICQDFTYLTGQLRNKLVTGTYQARPN